MSDILNRMKFSILDIVTGEPLNPDARPDLYVSDICEAIGTIEGYQILVDAYRKDLNTEISAHEMTIATVHMLRAELAAVKTLAHDADRARDGLREQLRLNEELRAELARQRITSGEILELSKAREDKDRLDWAERNPEKTIAKIHSYWATCGAGFREEFFSFRAAIDAAREEK